MKIKTVNKLVSNLLSSILIVSLIFMVFIIISSKVSSDGGGEPEIFGYQLKTVLSGSMEPEFKTGSIIAVKPGGDMRRFEEGDVITFMEGEGTLITHRVEDVVKSVNQIMYETKGDNNEVSDRELVLSDNVVAEYTGFTIPYMGYIASFGQSKIGRALMLLLPGLLLIIYASYTLWQGVSQLEKEKKPDHLTNETEKVNGSI